MCLYYPSPCPMLNSHNNRLPHVKTAQVESVYGLIKADRQMDLPWECLGSFCYTLTNAYRYIWHPAEEELTRKWAAADRNRSALWPTTCSLCMVPAPSGCRARGKTPFRAMRHQRGWMSKDLLRALEHCETQNMNNVSGLFWLSLSLFYWWECRKGWRSVLRWKGSFFFILTFLQRNNFLVKCFHCVSGETESYAPKCQTLSS